tara:strand:- start:414 stop:1040 length:627 start_codon:yes stop_codon:yes gene_type:complete
MPTVSLKTFLKKGFLEKTIRNSPEVAMAVDKTFRRRVAGLKGAALADFDRHPVTREIKQGPDSNNTSNTLGGTGNLFSFIGFYSSDNPTEPVREMLKNYLNVIGRQTARRSNKGVMSYRYSINVPTLSTFDIVSKMPWESGNSWVKGIETGISGFSNYMYLNYGDGKIADRSRSGKAVQSKNKINIGVFKPTAYISEILDKYRKRMAQ